MEKPPKNDTAQLLEKSAEILLDQAKKKIILNFDLPFVIALIAQLQLAFRHPRNIGSSRLAVEKFTRELIEQIDPSKGELYQMLMLGFNPDFDT